MSAPTTPTTPTVAGGLSGAATVESSVAGKVVLITGGGTGMGAATATLLASLGAHPIVLGLDEDPIADVARATGGLGHVGDAADPAAVAAAVRAGTDAWGGIDALINCAGGGPGGTVADLTDEEWDAALRHSLRTAIVASRACLPSLIPRRGSIVVIGSLASIGGYPGMAGYMTAKHALVGLVRSMAVDYGPKGVRVNAICPGNIRTPMGDRGMRFLAGMLNTTLDDAYHQATRLTPLGRPGLPIEIARTSTFLISDWASYLTGVILPADGGADCAESSMFSLMGYGTGTDSTPLPDMSRDAT